MGNNSNFNLIYEELIFEQNLNILCEEIEHLESIITEENFLDVCKSIFEKVKNFFSMSIEAFTKGYHFAVDFCKKVFQLTHIKTIMNSLGLSDEFLGKLVSAVKGSLIVIPIAKIGYDTVKNTYKDIHDQDVCVLIDRAKFNKECGKLFSQKNFWEKAWTIVKTGAKNLVFALLSEIPLILKCVLGYAVASGFDQAIKDPQFLTEAQKESLDKADKVIGKLGDSTLTHEQAMQTINQGFQYDGKSAPTMDMLLRSEIMKNNSTYDPKTKTWVNTYGKHYNTTNHGAMELDGTRTRFDTEAGKYVTEKCSPTEYLYNLQQEYGIPTLGGAVPAF